MLEYTANAKIKDAMQRAHQERAGMLRHLLRRVFDRSQPRSLGSRSLRPRSLWPRVSRWA